MKFFLKKLGVHLALLLIIPITSLLASENTNVSTSPSQTVPKIIDINSRFILGGKELIDPRTIQKIDEMGRELFHKTGVNVYIYTKKSFLTKKVTDMKEKLSLIKEYEMSILEKADKPYVLISMAIADTHINMYNSESLKDVIDKELILGRTIIPIIASQDKNSLDTKVSVALLNGYGEITDVVAKELKGIKLDSTIESGASEFKDYWRIFMYLLVIIGLGAYFYATRIKGRNV
jgi:hypothetical protein